MQFLTTNPLLVLIVAAIVALLLKSLRVANQYERSVVFRLGKFNRTAGPGLYLVWPFIEWLVKLDLRTITANVEQQEGITRDNVPIKVDAVIWYRIMNPEHAVMQVKNVSNAVVQVSLTTLRTVLGQHTLDEILKAQDTIAEVMQKSIDSVTEPWGVKVELVQMKNVEIPPSMQPWLRKPRPCAKNAPASSRPRPSWTPPNSYGAPPRSSCKIRQALSSGVCR
jgi:regulator of protease activity HflC (stomatin/prohibitin superfamily)